MYHLFTFRDLPHHLLKLSKFDLKKIVMTLFQFFVYLLCEREREREHVGEGQRERERENPKQALHCQYRAQHGTRYNEP